MMGYQIQRREDTSPLCPLKKCMCFDLRMGTFVGGWVILVTTLMAWIMVILDMAAWANDNFEIAGSYYTWWRRPFWKGFYLCDIIMIFAHFVLIVACILLITSILRPGSCVIYVLRPVVKAWWIVLLLQTLTELGVSIYTYSFYGLAAWRLFFLVFSQMLYIIRFLCSVGFIFVAYSYEQEINEELHIQVEKDPDEMYMYEAGSSLPQNPDTYAFA